MTDPISDMLTRIKNAAAVGRTAVTLPHSKINEDVAKVLAKSGFLDDVKVSNGSKFREMEITINDAARSSRITELNRLSRPGQRRYIKAAEIPKVRRGRGLVVMSTSHGIMTGDEARAKKLGGELICEVF